MEQVLGQELGDVDGRGVRRRRDVDLADGRRSNRIDGAVVVVEVGGPLDGGAVGPHRVAGGAGVHSRDVEEDDGRQTAWAGADATRGCSDLWSKFWVRSSVMLTVEAFGGAAVSTWPTGGGPTG